MRSMDKDELMDMDWGQMVNEWMMINEDRDGYESMKSMMTMMMMTVHCLMLFFRRPWEIKAYENRGLVAL